MNEKIYYLSPWWARPDLWDDGPINEPLSFRPTEQEAFNSIREQAKRVYDNSSNKPSDALAQTAKRD